MCVPLCTVALTDIYKLPSDGGSGSSHINHCEHQVPHFSQAPRLPLLIFFTTYWSQRTFLLFLKRNVFSNNSKSVLYVFFLCWEWDFCWFYFSNTGNQILCSYPIIHPSSRHPQANHPGLPVWFHGSASHGCMCTDTFFLCFKHNNI